MEKQSVIKIKGESFIVKTSFRALMQFEEMTGRMAYDVSDSVNDRLKLFYCMLCAANRGDFNMPFDAFIDTIDASPELYTQFESFLISLIPTTEKAVSKKKVEKR